MLESGAEEANAKEQALQGCRRHGDSLFAVLQMSATVWRREEKPGGVWNAARPALE